ncbi:hypothetical protein D3C78_1704120 [compost metagenome]
MITPRSQAMGESGLRRRAMRVLLAKSLFYVSSIKRNTRLTIISMVTIKFAEKNIDVEKKSFDMSRVKMCSSMVQLFVSRLATQKSIIVNDIIIEYDIFETSSVSTDL